MHQKFTICILIFIILSVNTVKLFATHLRAGELTGRQLHQTELTWEFTLKLYVDANTSVSNSIVDVSMGDGTTKEVLQTSQISHQQYRARELIYVFQHTFAAAGSYKVGFYERNRASNIHNILSSETKTFYIETEISAAVGSSSIQMPVPVTPPLLSASLGKRFLYHATATDPDGDSLNYKLITPRQHLPDGRIIDVTGYRDPAEYGGHQEDGSGASVFNINIHTGVITWDTPGQVGLFVIAIMIEKWRWNPSLLKHEQIGFIIRDMIITVNDVPTTLAQVMPAHLSAEIYPNPARLSTLLKLTLSEQSPVTLKLYNSTGKLLNSEMHSDISAGERSFVIDISLLTPGFYICQVQTSKGILRKKLVVQ
jgi:hypothetical protein